MRTVEDYWNDYESLGFVRSATQRGLLFTASPEIGKGGFEIWGDTTSVMACISDMELRKSFVVLESTHEKMLEFGQFYEGDVSFYQRRNAIFPIDHGLNFLVSPPFITGYKKMEAGVRLLNIGFAYREKFFKQLPYELPEDFWEVAASVLNPEAINIPSITLICEQVKNCSLTGIPLKIFVQGKALEAFAIILEYIYAHRQKPKVHISAEDRPAFEIVKKRLEREYKTPLSIKVLAREAGINQQKLMDGFKQLYGSTIYGYVQRVRMNKAAELLLSSNLSVKEIAIAVGYHGDGHFQQAFQK